MRNCYTYLIGWSKMNVYYYGKQTRLGCHPSKFWVNYYTSSKYVDMFRKIYGEPDIIKIRKTFGEDFLRCSKHEVRVLSKMNCAKDPRFLNRRNMIDGTLIGTTGTAPAYDNQGNYLGLVSCDDTSWGITIFGINKNNKTISDNLKKINKSKIEEGLHHFVGDNNPSRRKVKSGTHHWLKSNNCEQRQAADEHQRQLVKNRKHFWQSETHAKNTGLRTIKLIEAGNHPFSQIVICPHCGKEGPKASMKRWHFDKCKTILSNEQLIEVNFDKCKTILSNEQLIEVNKKNIENGRAATRMRMENKLKSNMKNTSR